MNTSLHIIVTIAVAILGLAVFVVDELEKKEVKDNNEECHGGPEEHGKAAQMVPMLVHGNHAVLMSRSLNRASNLECMFSTMNQLHQHIQ